MKLTEKTVKINYIYRGKIINLRCDDALLPDGAPCIREMVEHSGGASVLCIKDGKVLLVRQFRYAYGKELYEIPAGKLNEGEEPAQAAIRELKEETGLSASVREIFLLYPTPGYTNERLYVFEAFDIVEGEQVLDEGEFLNLIWMPLKEAVELVRQGEIHDVKTVTALLYAQKYL